MWYNQQKMSLSDLVIYNKMPIFDHIVDNIYLGNIDAVKDSLCMEDIDVVINLSNSRYQEYSQTTYYHMDISDNTDSNIRQFFDQLDEIVKNTNSNHNILIHCFAGISRSVTMVLYYIMKYKKMSLKDAYFFLCSVREQNTCPNYGFFRQLLICEKLLYGKNSMKYEEIA